MVHSESKVKKRRSDPSQPRRNASASADVALVSRRRALWPAAFSMCFGLALAWSTTALGNPEGGQIVAGSASIEQSSPSRLDVIQHSDKAIIDWRKFSIDSSEHTNFQQPSASAAALNRVTGGDASSILGRLTANGQIFLVNPNGVFFGRGSRVDVAGLVATTADIRNQDFLDGRYVFDQPSDKPNASVVNQGHIDVGENGFAVLAAPHVRNEGLIYARLGRVVLAGANRFTLDFEGDGLLTFEVGSEVTDTPLDEDGQPVEALVSNLGTIIADGGTIALTARAADAVMDNVINMDGVVQARAVAVRGGEIVLSGGDSGIVEVAGDIDVSGREQGQSGGTVKVLGDKVGLFDGAHIDASGDAGGGEALIGGNLRGEGAEPNARRTYVAPEATVKADGVSEGDGGKVIVWADEVTGFNGEISARGGSESGNGGFVEVSGKKDLSFHGRVDLTVVDGDAGTLLLDPENITIVNGGGAPDDGQLDDSQILADDSPGATFIISEQALEALPNADVVLQATNDITIEDLADDELLFAAGPGGSITFTVNRDLGSLNGSFVMDPGDTIRAPGRDVRIFTGISNGANTIGAVDTSSSTAGGEIEIRPGSIIVEGSISIGTLNSSSEFGAGGLISVGTFNLTITNGIDSTGAASSGDILLLGEEIDLPGTLGSVQGTNAQLILRPRSLSRNIAVGGTDNATAALDLTSTDLSALADGFLSIEIGSEDLGGSNGQMTVEGAAFNDPVTLAADILSVDGEIQTNGNSLTMTAGNVVDINADINTTGGTISIRGSAIDTTGSDLSSSSTVGPGGDITLNAEGDVTTGGALTTWGTSRGGDIRLTSSTGALALGDNLVTGTTVVTAGGEFTTDEGGSIILLADGDVNANQIFSGGEINAGDISIVSSTGGISIAGLIRAAPISAPAVVDSVGGSVTLEANGNIVTNDVLSFGSVGGGSIGITSSNGAIDTIAGRLDSSSIRGDGGAIALEAAEGIVTGSINSDSISSASGGSIRLDSGGVIDTSGGILDSTSNTGRGGAITLATQGGNITTATLASRTLGSSAGGDITLIVDGVGGSIDTTAGELDSSSASANGNGGAITLEAPGGIVAGAINSTGGAGSGDILLVGEEINLLGSPGSVQATNASLSLQPFTTDRDIIIGGEVDTDALDLTSDDLDALADGFLRIGIGSGNAGGSGGSMTVAGASFNDPFTLRANVINVDGEIQTNGSSLLVNASNEANVNADITTAGGAISIGGSTIDTTGSVLSSLSTVGQGGEIRLDGVGNVATGDISSSGVLGGGSINISSVQGEVDTTEGSLESFSDGAGGAIALEAAGNIATDLIRSRSFGAASGGSIRLDSGGAIDTTGGVLESSSSGASGGSIALTTQGGNILTALLISEAFGETGAGGDITFTVNGATGSIDTTAGDLRSSSSGGGAGAIALTTQGGNISTGIVHSRALGGTGAGGGITVSINGTTGSIDTTAGDLDASSFGGVAGAINLTTQGGNISTGVVASQGPFGSTGDGGDITLVVGGGDGSIDTAALTSTSYGGDGGAITLRTQNGNIIADAILTNSNPDVDGFGGDVTVEANGDIATGNIFSRGPLGGGNISISSSGGLIDGTVGILDSFSTDGVGGTIALEAAGGIATGAISSTGAAGSGDILLVGQEIDLLGSPGSVQATNASVGLQPSTSTQGIFVGGEADSNAGGLDLTATDLAALADDFASITIGRNDGSGTISIDSAGISLNDPLILQSPATGGIIAANGPMQTTGSLRATAPTIGLRDVSTNDVQNYTGSVTFNSDYVTGGGLFTVEGDSTLASNTTVTTDGGDVNFVGDLEGPGELTITAGSGDILFQGDVGAQIPLGLVSVASAQNISLGGQFVTGPSEFVYDGNLTSPDPSLEVDSLFIDPDATSATLFGSVGGDSGREAALAVEGASGDPDFTINGFVMGTSEPEVLAEPGGLTAAEPNTNTAEEIEVAKQDALIAEEPTELEPVEEIDYSSVEYQPVLPVRFTPQFSMSDFTMNATIKGGWPFVVDYQLERPGEVRVKIAAEGVKPLTVELDGTTTDRRLEEFKVPQRFGAAVKPVSISVIALEEGGTKTVPLQLYGLGAGPKAVGSIAIDPVDFGPPLSIRPQEGEEAAYRFRSQSAFDNVIVDFCSVTRTATEHVYRSVHYEPHDQGIEQNDWIGKREPKNWNGRNTKKEVSPGPHKLQVRAWDDGEEWVGAWSGGFIRVAD